MRKIHSLLAAACLLAASCNKEEIQSETDKAGMYHMRTAAAFQNRSRTLIYPLTLFLGAATVIQIALPSLHVTWLCVTLLSVLYYIYCSEMWNQLDALTGLLDQNSYLNRASSF